YKVTIGSGLAGTNKRRRWREWMVDVSRGEVDKKRFVLMLPNPGYCGVLEGSSYHPILVPLVCSPSATDFIDAKFFIEDPGPGGLSIDHGIFLRIKAHDVVVFNIYERRMAVQYRNPKVVIKTHLQGARF